MVLTKRGLVLGTTAILVAAVTVTGAGIRLSKSWAGFRESPKELVDEVWQTINYSYVDGTFNGVDWRTVRNQYLGREYGTREDAYKAINQMLEKLGDPYTRFMDPEEFKSLQIETSGELMGVGIQIAQDEKTKKITVVAPIEDSPAFAAGVLAQDVITKIDGKSTQGMDVNEAVSMIRGPVGTPVTLTLQRGNKQLEFKITRARIEIRPVRSSYRQSPVGGIGYIRLTQFSSNAAVEMRQAIEDLEKKNVAGYILDLRSNPGGLLNASTEIARMWIDNAPIVSTVNRQGESERTQAGQQNLTDKPLVVLIDEGSASASEILAGALQDDGRAVLVGNKTFGKGLVQSVRPLGDGSGLAVTIAKYFTPKGTDINKKGIEPNVKIPLTNAQREQLLVKDRDKIGTPTDIQYSKALEVLNQRIAAAGRAQIQPSPLSAPKVPN